MDILRKASLFAILAIVGLGLSGGAGWSQSQNAETEYRAELQQCKKLAEPKARDECVSNAKNRYERGKKAEKMPADKGAMDKDKAGGKKSDQGKKAKN